MARVLEATGATVGDVELDELVHAATGLPFVGLPGGELDVGIRPEELEEARARLGPVAHPAEWERAYAAAQPLRRIRIAPFACALHPVPDALAPASLRGRLRDRRDAFPDIAAWDRGYATLDEASAAELRALEQEDPEAAAMFREELEAMGQRLGAEPVILQASEVGEVLAAFPGARLLTEDEWEYVARAGGTRAWIEAPDELSRHPFGIRGLAFGTWLQGGAVRGGAWSAVPTQDSWERIALHAGYRPAGGGMGVGLLLAVDR